MRSIHFGFRDDGISRGSHVDSRTLSPFRNLAKEYNNTSIHHVPYLTLLRRVFKSLFQQPSQYCKPKSAGTEILIPSLSAGRSMFGISISHVAGVPR